MSTINVELLSLTEREGWNLSTPVDRTLQGLHLWKYLCASVCVYRHRVCIYFAVFISFIFVNTMCMCVGFFFFFLVGI